MENQANEDNTQINIKPNPVVEQVQKSQQVQKYLELSPIDPSQLLSQYDEPQFDWTLKNLDVLRRRRIINPT